MRRFRQVPLSRHQDIIVRYLRMCAARNWRPSLSGLVALMRAENRKGA